MADFRKVFEDAERVVRSQLESKGFKLDEMMVNDSRGSQAVSGSVWYVEKLP